MNTPTQPSTLASRPRRRGAVGARFLPPMLDGRPRLGVAAAFVLAALVLLMSAGAVFKAVSLADVLAAGGTVKEHTLWSAVHFGMQTSGLAPSLPVFLGVLVALEAGIAAAMLLLRRLKPLALAACSVFLVAAPMAALTFAPDAIGNVDCGCFGVLLDVRELWVLLARNSLLVLLALGLAWAWLPPSGARGPRRTQP